MWRMSWMLLLLLTGAAAATEKPAWELGAGLGYARLPHYPGADEHHSYVLPVPYFVYRGEYFRADRSGLMGVIYDSERLDLRLSLAGSIRVDSDDNEAREGMDDLDFAVEAGPTLQYDLYQHNHRLLRLELPVRAAFALGSGEDFMRPIGWTTNPRLYLRQELGDWTASSSLGPVFSDQSLHRYYYDVDQRFVTAERPYYEADAGLTGTRLSLSVWYSSRNWFAGTFFNYYSLAGAANEDSPLVRQDDYFVAGVAVAWVFARSARTVTGLED